MDSAVQDQSDNDASIEDAAMVLEVATAILCSTGWCGERKCVV